MRTAMNREDHDASSPWLDAEIMLGERRFATHFYVVEIQDDDQKAIFRVTERATVDVLM